MPGAMVPSCSLKTLKITIVGVGCNSSPYTTNLILSRTLSVIMNDARSWITDCALQIFVDCLHGGSNVSLATCVQKNMRREGFLVEW